MPASRQELIPQARALFAQGLTIADIAKAVGVSAGTVHRWKAADRKAGSDWEAARSTRQRKDPRALIAILEDRLYKIAQKRDMEDGRWGDTVQKISNVLHRERERLGDLSIVMSALAEFAAWAEHNVSEEDLAALYRTHEAYFAYLKRRGT